MPRCASRIVMSVAIALQRRRACIVFILFARAAAAQPAGSDAGAGSAAATGSNAIAGSGGAVASPAGTGSAAGSADEPPRIVHQAAPIYPDLPKGQVPGVVDVAVQVEIDPDGSPENPQVVSAPHPPFDDLATAAVLSWTFAPATHGGQPVAGALGVTVHFDPHAGGTAGGGELITVTGERHQSQKALDRGASTIESTPAQLS